MSAIDDLLALADSLAQRDSEKLKGVNELLVEIVTHLGEISDSLEKPEASDDGSIAQAIVEGMRGLTIQAPSMPMAEPPVVHVAAPAVSVTAASPTPTAWRLKIVARDGYGKPSEILLTPEN